MTGRILDALVLAALLLAAAGALAAPFAPWLMPVALACVVIAGIGSAASEATLWRHLRELQRVVDAADRDRP